MKVSISRDELYPFYDITESRITNVLVTMTLKKRAECMQVLKEFNKVQAYLKKRYMSKQYTGFKITKEE